MPLLWTQLISTSDRRDLWAGLEARIHDPLWLLTRQWQMGEFQGEDAGSPIRVTVNSDSFQLDRIQLGNTSRPYTPTEAPLEAIVERETLEQVPPDLRTRAQAGMQLMKQLHYAGLPVDRDRLLQSFGFMAQSLKGFGEPTIAAQLLMQRSPDASRLYAHFSQTLTDAQFLDIFPNATAEQVLGYRQEVGRWLQQYEALVGKPGQAEAWLEDRLEYQFSVSVPTDQGRVELWAEEYVGGRLDWDSFRIQSVNPAETSKPVRKQDQLLPCPVTYPGMPAPRWWEFENGTVDFGSSEMGDRDVGRLLLAEFVMTWGNDWFMVPLDVPTGSLCRITDLLVTDTFGVTSRILPQSFHSPNWRMNDLSQATPPPLNHPITGQFLFVPPVLPVSHQAPPVEDVLFLRDEMANMAWAIEKTLPDWLGRPQQTIDQAVFQPHSLAPLSPNRTPQYQVMTNLPDFWLPLLPVRQATPPAHFLVRAGLLDELQTTAPEPQGYLLSKQAVFQVHDEEIPRSGAEVSRAYQLVRWYGGQRSLWLGRQKQMGVGEVRSHLEFDQWV